MAGAAPSGPPLGFLLLVYGVHFLDILLRYGTFQNIPGNAGLWALFALLYFLIAYWALRTQAFNFSTKTVLTISLIAYIVGPALSLVAAIMPQFGALKALMLIIILASPAWIWATVPYYPRLSTIWVLLWLFLIIALFFSDIRTYAYEQAGYTSGSLPPWASMGYVWNKLTTGFSNLWTTVSAVPGQVEEQIKRSIAMASGDYYTGKVDQAAQKRLGVYLENFKPSENVFYENIPVSAYATMKAETLDAPLDISIACEAKQQALAAPVVGTAPAPIPASKILPQSAFNVITSDQYDVDCIWDKGILKKGTYDLKMLAEFPFTTRAYLKTYIMDRDRLREYRRQNVDPLAQVPDKNPITIYTSGPVRVLMGIGQQQPIALGQQGETLQPWAIAIQNAWEGQVIEVTGVTLLVPKGLKISDAGDLKYTESTCSALPAEEQPSCDESLVTVYSFAPEELALPVYKNLTTKNIRVYLQVTDPQKALGTAPIAVQNFKASVQYRYLLQRTAPATVKEEGMQ